MKHYGDICRMVGAEIEPVDCIIGGSPCQDLSIAGKRAGLAGARSGLYMEQIRIIREMRENDRKNGRTGEFIRPRYMVWENVPGAFSSNKGRDFAAVLEEAIRIAEPEAPDIPVPAKGWPTWGGYRDVDGRWSVAWRVLDAQWWGVPQRRRRIALVADFGGTSAHEILFNRKGVYGNPEKSGAAGKGSAGEAESGTACAVRIRGGCDGGGKGALVQTEKSGTLGTGNDQTVFCLQGNGIDRADPAGCNGKGWREDVSYTLNTIDRPAVCAGFKLGNSEQARSIGYQEERSPTLNAECGGNKPAVVYSFDSLASNSMKYPNPKSGCREVDTAKTLDTTSPDPSKNQGGIAILDMSHANDVIRECGSVGTTLQSRMGTGGNQVPLTYQKVTGTLSPGAHAGGYNGQDAYNDMLVCSAVDCRNFREGGEVNGTLQAKESGGQSLNLNNTVRQNRVVRRLTPLECERLQGFPSRKELDIRQMNKDEYIAWNLQQGNIIADAENGKVFATRGPGGVKLEKPKELLGSILNGYKVVSIRNGTTKLQCRVHRIIWISVNGVLPDGYCIDHINNDKKDNRICNLQILTPAENSHKAKEDGLYKTGEEHQATKISPELHDEIAYLYATNDFTIRELAEAYGISKSRVHQIVHEVGWTDIGAWTDEKGKLHKESSDSARYKALGNSIALPPWKWVLKRICAQYERDATLGSLFDGIGGFPLLWTQLNGWGSVKWASEIEPFCIAVTKRHFGDAEIGEAGDLWKHLMGGSDE